MTHTRSGWYALNLAIVLGTLCVGACGKPDHTSEGRSFRAIASTSNELRITSDNRILWNGAPVTEAELASLLTRSAAMENEPELIFQPEADSSYDKSARVLQIIKESGASKFGFVGNERYAADGPQESPR